MIAGVPTRLIFLAQKGKCFYCGKYLSPWAWAADNPRGWTKDHFVPKSKGGAKGNNNVVIACHPCNRKKGANLPTQKQQRKFDKQQQLLTKV